MAMDFSFKLSILHPALPNRGTPPREHVRAIGIGRRRATSETESDSPEANSLTMAYRNPGTRWLLFLLISGPILFAASAVQIIRSSPSTEGLAIWSFGHVLYVWIYVMNWRLRRLNKRLQ